MIFKGEQKQLKLLPTPDLTGIYILIQSRNDIPGGKKKRKSDIWCQSTILLWEISVELDVHSPIKEAQCRKI